MAGGLWIHKTARCGGVDGVIKKAVVADVDRIILKTRDGRSGHNQADAAGLVSQARECGFELWIWAWCYATNDPASQGYIEAQATRINDDARRLGAAGIVLNLEAPWSAAPNHRWASVLREQFGNKPTRKIELKYRCEDLITLIKMENPGRPVCVSTFPIPSAHALPFATMAEFADQIWPQVYFSGMGYNRKIAKSVEQWTKLGAKSLHYSGPGWLGGTKQKAMATALREELTPDAQIDWWVADKMDSDDLESAAAIGQAGECK